LRGARPARRRARCGAAAGELAGGQGGGEDEQQRVHAGAQHRQAAGQRRRVDETRPVRNGLLYDALGVFGTTLPEWAGVFLSSSRKIGAVISKRVAGIAHQTLDGSITPAPDAAGPRPRSRGARRPATRRWRPRCPPAPRGAPRARGGTDLKEAPV
jgi:hypothetical protein